MLALLVAALLAGATDDSVVRPHLNGFVVGSQQSAGGASMTEEVPVGETVEHWTRMVTTQRFGGIPDTIDAKGFLDRLASSASESCSGASASKIGSGVDEIRLDCPSNPQTGLPETFLARAVLVGHTMHVFQVAWRRVPSAADLAWGEHYLHNISVRP